MSSTANLRVLAEAQSGRLRGLAMELHNHADHASLITPGTRKIIRSWADTIVGVADELVRAGASNDPSREVRRFNKLSRALLIPLGLVGIQTVNSVTEAIVGELDLTEKIVTMATDAINAGFDLDDAAGIPIEEDPRFDVVGNIEVSLGKAFLDLGWPATDRTYRVEIEPFDANIGFVMLTLVAENGDRRTIGLAGKNEVAPITVLNAADQMVERWRDDAAGPGMFRISAEPNGTVILGGS